jgi:hypothetical protein
MLIWNSSVSLKKVPPPKAITWIGNGPNPVALMRTSWTDPKAIFVGFKGGSASLNHAHMDVGSFVMDANGLRWAMDFGMQDYESLDSKSINLWDNKQDGQRWSIFRYINHAHNTLTIDGKLQQVAGSAPFIGSDFSNKQFLNVVADLSNIYKDVLSGARRGVAIVDEKYVMITDELQASAESRKVRWTMLTPAEVQIMNENTALLTQNGKKLVLKVQSPFKVTMKTWAAQPPNTYDAPNPGTIFTGFEVIIPANSKSTLQVALVPYDELGHLKDEVKPLSTWNKMADLHK